MSAEKGVFERSMGIGKYVAGVLAVVFAVSGSLGIAVLSGATAGGAHYAEKKMSKSPSK